MKNKITEQDINNIMNQSDIKTDTLYDKLTMVSMRLPNGFVLTETSGAVDKSNYNFDIGKQICLNRIKNKLWELEGYALAKQLAE